MSEEPANERTCFRRLRLTPLRDLVRGRLTGRLDLDAVIAAAELPASLSQVVRDVIRRTRLFRLEKIAVAQELAGHFRDGLDQGVSPGELARDFGDPVLAARLIRRAKRRNRPLAWRATVRSLQAAWGLFGIVIVLYGIAALRFFAGSPNPSVDFLSQINAATLAAPTADRAWPEYRAAILALKRPPELSYRRTPRPGEPGWEVVEKYLAGSHVALEHIRAGATRPVLGYEIGFAIAARDVELWPRQAGIVVPANNQIMFGILLPHLGEMRRLTMLMVDDARRAAARGEPDTALADIETVLSMSGQVLESGFILNDLVALSMFTRCIDVVGELLHEYPDLFSDEQLTTLAHRLGGLAGGAPMRVSMEGERVSFADLVQHSYTDNGRGDGHLTWDGLKLWTLLRGTVKPTDPVMMAAGPVVGAFGASRAELVNKYDRLLAMVLTDATVPLWKRGRSSVDVEIERIQSSFTETVKFLPIALLMPAMSKVSINAEMLTQRRDAALVVIALHLYRRHHGAWPSELATLVPLFLPDVPPDRFDGGPIKYILRGGEPVLYVVGTDRDDDHGRRPPPPAHAESAMVWLPLEELAQAVSGTVPHHTVSDGDWVLWPPAAPEPLGPPDPDNAAPIYTFARHGS